MHIRTRRFSEAMSVLSAQNESCLLWGLQIPAFCRQQRSSAERHSRKSQENLAMKNPSSRRWLKASSIGFAVAALSSASLAAVDGDAALALAKKSDCMKCHAIDKDKKASSYKSIAAKWKGKADAEAKLVDALTKSPKVKMKDGTEEEHKAIPTKDMGEIKNLIAWILSQ
jgi:cytochrome c